MEGTGVLVVILFISLYVCRGFKISFPEGKSVRLFSSGRSQKFSPENLEKQVVLIECVG